VNHKPSPEPGTVTPIEPALRVQHADEIAWSESTDVLVVGWGAAGACAAIEARAAGASVIVVDRFGGGGASALSGGVVYAGGGTPFQREAGFEDTPRAMFDYLRREVNGAVSDATLARFCDDSAGNLAWLQAQGVRFGGTMSKGKTSYPPDGVFLYHSGNELVPAYRGPDAPAPRGHRAVATGQSGAALFAALQDATQRSGARCITRATVRRLVVEQGDGGEERVVGVELWQLPADDPRSHRHAELDGIVARHRQYRPRKADAARQEAAAIERAIARPRFVRALRGVVLSTGGHVFNPGLIEQHAPQFRRGWPIGGAGCDGSGLRLGQSVGAQARDLDNVSAWRFLLPPVAWVKGLVVNARGERFCNEQVYGATLGHALMQQGGEAWLILDARLRSAAIRECLFGGLWAFQALPALALMLFGAKKAPTLQALAQRIGAPPERLLATVEAANAAARGERDDPQGKSADLRHALQAGPFHALNISIGQGMFPLPTLTLGGLRVNERSGHVLDAQGREIAGLFAAGRTAIGIASSRYVSGLSLADCVFSGGRAGGAPATAATAADLTAAAAT